MIHIKIEGYIEMDVTVSDKKSIKILASVKRMQKKTAKKERICLGYRKWKTILTNKNPLKITITHV